MGAKINGYIRNIGVIRICLFFFVVHALDTETLELDEDAWALKNRESCRLGAVASKIGIVWWVLFIFYNARGEV